MWHGMLRPPRNFGRLGRHETSLMLLSVAATVAVAAPAYADPPPNNDADFLAQLTAAGLSYQDPAQAVAVAKAVCQLVDKGTPDTEKIEKNLQLRNEYSPEVPDRRRSSSETAWGSG